MKQHEFHREGPCGVDRIDLLEHRAELRRVVQVWRRTRPQVHEIIAFGTQEVREWLKREESVLL